ncbi:MAG: isochorismatase family protein, partial [Armatimonadetes bacterium]|nr:isochorismatase family protein [Armatimonadota bacterium]
TDYCVKASALDAVAAGFEAVAVTDAMAGVEVSPGDTEAALAAMGDAGVQIISSPDLLSVTE